MRVVDVVVSDWRLGDLVARLRLVEHDGRCHSRQLPLPHHHHRPTTTVDYRIAVCGWVVAGIHEVADAVPRAPPSSH